MYNVGIPMERWALDILGPLPLTHKKNSYLLVIEDCFTKWIDAIPMKNKKGHYNIPKINATYHTHIWYTNAATL
jgi:hypothetical protein